MVEIPEVQPIVPLIPSSETLGKETADIEPSQVPSTAKVWEGFDISKLKGPECSIEFIKPQSQDGIDFCQIETEEVASEELHWQYSVLFWALTLHSM